MNFHEGNKIMVGGLVYTLSGSPHGGRGFQFRTHVLEDDYGKKFIAKITSKHDLFMREISVYNYLHNKGFTSRYFPRIRNWGTAYYCKGGSFVRTAFSALVLDYYDAETLERFRHRRYAHPKDVRLKVVDKIRRRFAMLHELGVIHGDVNNAKNYLVRQGRRGTGVVIIDFGLSRVREDFKTPEAFVFMARRESLQIERQLSKIAMARKM